MLFYLIDFEINFISLDKYIFRDKWHKSPYYCISRAVFAFQGLSTPLAELCIQRLLSQQNSDGGWGLDENSSLEETSYAVLAICFWIRCHGNSGISNIL